MLLQNIFNCTLFFNVTHFSTPPHVFCLESFFQQVILESNYYYKINRLGDNMITANTSIFNKGFFMNTPSPFDGERFELWKIRFEIFY